MRSYKAKEPTHSVRVSRAVYVSWCNAARDAGLPLEEWLPRAVAIQISQEAKERLDQEYIEYTRETPIREPFEVWREAFEKKIRRH
jgi:hypothetical protein